MSIDWDALWDDVTKAERGDLLAITEEEIRNLSVVPLRHPRHIDYRVAGLKRIAEQLLAPTGEMARAFGSLTDPERECILAVAGSLMDKARLLTHCTRGATA